MKWDNTRTNAFGERIRTAYLQDAVGGEELVDRLGLLTLFDKANHEPKATARQIAAGVWQARVYQRRAINQQWRKLPVVETKEFAGKGAKDAAIAFMLAE